MLCLAASLATTRCPDPRRSQQRSRSRSATSLVTILAIEAAQRRSRYPQEHPASYQQEFRLLLETMFEEIAPRDPAEKSAAGAIFVCAPTSLRGGPQFTPNRGSGSIRWTSRESLRANDAGLGARRALGRRETTSRIPRRKMQRRSWI